MGSCYSSSSESFDCDEEVLVALYDFEATSESDLTIREGDMLLVLDRSLKNWIKVENMQTEEQGYVPNDYVTNHSRWEATVHRDSDSTNEILVAIHNFTSINEHDLTIKKGDRFLALDSSLEPWRKVRNIVTGQQGYVPSNYVAEEGSLNAKDWFFGEIDRWEAQNLLWNSVQPCGTFLIRFSATVPGALTLSVKHLKDFPFFEVRHQLIERDAQNRGYRLNNSDIYQSLDDLIEATDWLTEPCTKLAPPIYTISSQSDDAWEIDRNRIKLKQLLGKGNYGQVNYGICDGQIPVAVKQLKDVSSQEFYEEALNMRRLSHPKLVHLYGVCTVNGPFWLIQEYMKQGDLLTLLRHDNGRTLNMAALVSIASQVAEGMEYLESKNFVHRDLAARNILMSNNNVAKIGDFGLSRLLTKSQYVAVNSKVAIQWTDPFAYVSHIFTVKSDVWSYGILLMEVFSYGVSPYSELNNTRDLIDRLQNGYRMKPPPNVPLDIHKIALQCWCEPENRPSFKELRSKYIHTDTIAGLLENYEYRHQITESKK